MIGTEIIGFLAENTGTVATTVGPFVGALFTAIFLRNNTATKEFEKVKAGKMNEVADDLLKEGKMSYSEYYKAHNFLKIAKIADRELAGAPKKENSGKYDFDWFVRFYEAGGGISNEEMQDIWAKILAGEINNPNTYSLRTIEVLKNLNQQEAKLFKEICPKCIVFDGTVVLPNDAEYLEKRHISVASIIRLSECGLINDNSLLTMTRKISPQHEVICKGSNLLIMASSKNESSAELTFSVNPLSLVGVELFHAVGTKSDDESIKLFARKAKKENLGIHISVHRITYDFENQLSYELRDVLEEED
jgi:hypothetical protein